MADPSYQEPKLGATFYPGGYDDFQMPELISPSPQRVMPEVPSNMQEGLVHLELEATEVRYNRMNSQSSVSSSHSQYRDPRASMHQTSPQPQPQQPPASGPKGYTADYDYTNAAVYQNAYDNALYPAKTPDKASPSPFPKLRDAGPNVPPSDDGKEAILERARSFVLNSRDAEMQLAWAQDALLWVEIAVLNRARLAQDQPVRPSTPHVEHELQVDAVSIINFLADQCHPKALFLKATWYEFGRFGYPLDRKEAFQGYRKAAEKEYARAEYRIGTQYESIQDTAKAIKHYTMGVSQGDSASNYRMGMMSLLGQHGQPQDYQLGIKRIRFAADTADENAPQGAYVYGMLLARELPNITVPEEILPVDIDQARQFIEKAAFLGFAKAQLKMGSAYELCLLGCDFLPALSLHYNALAARQGEADADMAISKWFLCGYEGVFEKNEELAFTHAKRAAQSGLPTAIFAMGYFYEIGVYVASDLRQAQTWYQKAADQGSRDAVDRLESISQQKMLSKKDHEQIAITRIKSQYGSRRGTKPEHLREKWAPLPAMVEENVDMPDPKSSRNSMSGFMIVPPEDSHPPARPKSTAPYPGPENSNPPARPKSTALYPDPEYSHPPSRPKSTAPYPGPEDSNPPARPKSTALYPDPEYNHPPSRPLPTAPYPGPEDSNPPARPKSTAQYPDPEYNHPPSRPISTAPYPGPEDSNPPARPKSTALYPDPEYNHPPSRPKSTAPYPEDDVAPSDYGQLPSSSRRTNQLRPLSGPPADRPQSAFGIRPLHLQSQDQHGQGYDLVSPIRPATSMGSMAVPEGRGSNPVGGNRVVSASWEPQAVSKYRQPPPGRQSIPKIETSYHQPNDDSQVRRNKLQKTNPNTGKPQPAFPQHNTPDPGYPVTPIVPYRALPLSAPASRTRHDSYGRHTPTSSYDSRLTPTSSYDARMSLPSNSGQRLERFDSMPQSASRPSQKPLPANLLPASPPPPRTSSAAPSTSSMPPSRTSSAAPSSASVNPNQPNKPAKEGPKTFDEMGIPSQRNESDCIVM